MDGAFGARKSRKKPAINITPLIDVMFLLIIFFMVSSTFREQLGIDISLPLAETATEQERSPYEIAVRADGTLYLGEQQVSVLQLRQGLADMLRKEPDAGFVLRADERAAFQQVLTAIDVARAVGGNRLVIPARPLE